MRCSQSCVAHRLKPRGLASARSALSGEELAVSDRVAPNSPSTLGGLTEACRHCAGSKQYIFDVAGVQVEYWALGLTLNTRGPGRRAPTPAAANSTDSTSTQQAKRIIARNTHVNLPQHLCHYATTDARTWHRSHTRKTNQDGEAIGRLYEPESPATRRQSPNPHATLVGQLRRRQLQATSPKTATRQPSSNLNPKEHHWHRDLHLPRPPEPWPPYDSARSSSPASQSGTAGLRSTTTDQPLGGAT